MIRGVRRLRRRMTDQVLASWPRCLQGAGGSQAATFYGEEKGFTATAISGAG